MKKAVVMLLVVALLAGVFGLAPVRAAEGVTIQLTIGSTKAYVNSKEVILDQPPIIENGRTLVPFRFIGEALGATISWNAETRTIGYVLGDMNIILTIGSTTAYVNSVATKLDVAPKILPSGRTVVPVRFIGETIGAKVDWNGNTKMVTITVSATPSAEVKVIRHTDSWPCYTDPAVGSDYASSIALCNLYDSLVFPNPDGSVKPWLAKSWVISGDGLTYTFELVSGVKFHNGDNLTADDVVFSLQRIMTIGEGYGYLFTTSVKEAKALDTYHVQFTLKQSFGPFLGALVRLYILDKKQVMANLQAGSYGEFKDYGKGWLVTNDAGSGPYKIKQMKTAEYLLMEKFDGYWAGWANRDAPQYVKEIGTTEGVTVRTLISRGELEITDQWQTSENLAAIDKLPNTDVASFFEGSVLNIMLNTKKAPTDDIHFRKALAYCVDYQQIMDKIFPGSRPSTAIARSTPGYDPNLQPYTFDLTKAEAELKQSKYYGQLDKYHFELYWVSEVPDEEKIALMVQANAAELGIKVDVVKVPWLSLIDLLAKPETTPNGSVIFVAPHYAEAGSMLESRYESSSCGTWEQGEWLQNPEIDTLIKAAIATIDQKERFQKYYTIQEKISELCPTLWILEQAVKQAYRSDYVVFPAAEAVKEGKQVNPVMGYNFYYRDFKVFPNKAQQPYTPFIP